MIRFNFPQLEESLQITQNSLLVIENRDLFSSIVTQLYYYDEEGSIKLTDVQYKKLKESEIMLVTDILGYELNTPTIMKKIISDIEAQLNEKPEQKTEIERLTLQISDIIEGELINHDLDLSMIDLDIPLILKSYRIKIEQRSQSILQKILEIIQVYQYLSTKKILIFVNTCSYLTRLELEEVMNYITMSDVSVLFIEPNKVEGMSQIVLDEDFYMQQESC